MMPVEQLLPDDHPMIIAWKAYSETGDYDNTRNWAKHDKHVDGSLWAAFAKGYEASAPTLAAENAALKALVAEMVGALERAPRMRHFEILAEAMAEVKATNDGQSDNSISEIVDWCISEINALPPRASALITRAKEAAS